MQRMANLHDKISRSKRWDNNPDSSRANTCPTENDLTKPDPLLHRISNQFIDPVLEDAYQIHCADHSYRRARVLVLSVIVVHIVLSATFAILEESHTGLDLLPREFNAIGEWLQWFYLLFGIPFAIWSEKTSLLRKRWKRWVSLIIIMLVCGGQIWLTYQVRESTLIYKRAITESLVCTLNITDTDSEYRSGLNVPQFLIQRNANIYGAFVAVASTLLTVVGSTFAVAVRLDFPHVVSVCLCTATSLFVVLSLYGIKHQAALICAYVFPGILLALSCYYADRTSRRAFASKRNVEKENELLGAALQEAEEALRNDAARESEKLAVKDGLLSSSSTCSSSPTRRQQLLESVRIAFDEIKLIKLVGRGGMGEVILGEYVGTKVVCKRMLRDHISVSTLKSFRSEIELMAGLRHPNIVQFIGATWDNCSNICMVMEYMQNGDVHSVLHSAIGSRFTWSDPLLKIAIDAGQGMMYLHAQDPSIVHRDLKSVNLLCSATFGCKVSDFGLSRRQEDVDALTTVVGTPFWLAPEVIRNERYGSKADVYAFGIVLIELETRKTPYHDQSETGLKVLMKVANKGLRPTIPSNCLSQLRRLIEECIDDSAHKRPTFSEVLARLQGPIRQQVVAQPTIERRVLLKRQGHHRIDIILSDEEITGEQVEL